MLQPIFQRQEESGQIEQARAELARPYVEQLMQAGWNRKQADQYGQLLAANAEQMAPVFGMSPQEYLQQSFAGYRSMTQADFEAGNVGLFQEEDHKLADIEITPALYQASSTDSAVLQHETENSASTWVISEPTLSILHSSVKPSRWM